MASVPTCGHPGRKVFSNKMCKECATKKYLKKYSEKRADKIKNNPKAHHINKVSSQQKSLNAIYSILRKQLLPLHPVCEAQLPGCTRKATQIHHKAGRRGIWLIVSKFFAYLCNNCHNFCTQHSKEAVEIGLSFPINGQNVAEFSKMEEELIEKCNLNVKNVKIGHVGLVDV